MIQQFYGLERDPFSLTPDLDFLYESTAHAEAVAHLVYGLEQNERIILLYGDIGTGKTLALQRVVGQVSGTFIPILITVTSFDFEQLLRLVLLKVGVEVSPGSGSAEIVFRFETFLNSVNDKGRRILLVIDEAQNLSSETLESVRMLMNLGNPGSQALQMVLAGQLGLKAKLDHPESRQLMQRIRVVYQLELLTRKELEQYIMHRLRIAGREETLFNAEAIDKIHHISGGVPRIVNRVANQAMLNGFVDDAKRIGAKHVEQDPQGTLDSENADSGPIQVISDSRPRYEDTEPRMVLTSQETPRSNRGQPETRPRRPSRDERPPERDLQSRARGSRGRRAVLFAAVVVILAAASYQTRDRWLPEVRYRLARIGLFSALSGGATGAVDVELQDSKISAGAEDSDAVHSQGSDGGGSKTDVTTESTGGGNEESPEHVIASINVPPRDRSDDRKVASEAGGASKFYIHVASFRQLDRAENLRSRIVGFNVTAEVAAYAGPNGQDWQRVYVGPFASHDEAMEFGSRLQAAGITRYARVTNNRVQDDR